MPNHAFLTATLKGDNEGVAEFLAQYPELIQSDCATGLIYAAKGGHEAVVAQLLAASPKIIDVLDASHRTVLHWATRGNKESHNKIVVRLLALRPSLIDAVDDHEWTPLHIACYQEDNAPMVELLLAAKPELAFATNRTGNTPLHYAASRLLRNGAAVIKMLLQLNPEASRAANKAGVTPFDTAVAINNHDAVEVMQLHLTFGEIVSAFIAAKKSVERFRPVVESQCESLLLNRDVWGVVFEYLGFLPVKETGKFNPQGT